MALEQLANNAGTSLNGTINNSVTSLVVTSATGFPSTGNFRIVVESEVMIVTAVSGTTFTVTRGAEGTTGATHVSGIAVDHVLTAGALQQFRADTIVSGLLASRPTVGTAGRLYLPTDGYHEFQDDGVNWNAAGPRYPMNPGWDDSGFAWSNQGSAAWSKTNSGGLLTVDSSASTGIRLRQKSVPATPYGIIAYFSNTALPINANEMGIGLFFGDGTKVVVFGIGSGSNASGLQVVMSNWNSVTSFNAHVIRYPGTLSGWIKILNDGSNLYYLFSQNGINWFQFNKTTLGSFLGTITKYGIWSLGTQTGTSGENAYYDVLSLKEVTS